MAKIKETLLAWCIASLKILKKCLVFKKKKYLSTLKVIIFEKQGKRSLKNAYFFPRRTNKMFFYFLFTYVDCDKSKVEDRIIKPLYSTRITILH